MTLEGFKFIYHMEWGHRNWGRAIGGLFLLPFGYFAARKRLSPQTLKRCLGIGAILGFQGGMGWYMVKSGLGTVQLKPDYNHSLTFFFEPDKKRKIRKCWDRLEYRLIDCALIS